MNYKKEIARLVIEDHDLSDARLKMIYSELHTATEAKKKSKEEKKLTDSAELINDNFNGVFVESTKNLLEMIGCDISVQRAGQILSRIGKSKVIKRAETAVDKDTGRPYLVECIKRGYYYRKEKNNA